MYDTQEKVRAYWAFCDVLRAYGIPTKDHAVVQAVERALIASAPVRKAFQQYKTTLLRSSVS